MTAFKYNDGGRKAAGFKGPAGDCVTRAIAIATGKPYAEVYAELNALAASERPGARKGRMRGRRSSARTGIFKKTWRAYLDSLGWRWMPTMFIGSGCKVHLRASELPRGRLILNLSGHSAAFIDGVLHDVSDCSRGGMRCVYGYYFKP